MKELVRFEFRKLFRSKSFYICLGISVVLLVLGLWLTDLTQQAFITIAFSEAGEEIPIEISSDAIDALLSAPSNAGLDLLLGIVIALFVCRDYSADIRKNVIGKGYTRTQIFFSKTIAIMTATGVFLLLAWAGCFGFGCVLWGTEFTWNSAYLATLAVQLLGTLAMAALFFLVSVALRKAGGTIAINVLVPSVIGLLLQVLDLILDSQKITLANYWISNCFTEISATVTNPDVLVRCAVCFAVYLIVTLGGALLISRRQEA